MKTKQKSCVLIFLILIFCSCKETDESPKIEIDVPILLGNSDDFNTPTFSCASKDSGWKLDYLNHMYNSLIILENHRDSLFSVNENFTALSTDDGSNISPFILTWVFPIIDMSIDDHLISYISNSGLDTIAFYRNNSYEFMIRKDTSWSSHFAYQRLDKKSGTSTYEWVAPSVYGWERSDTASYLYYSLIDDHWSMKIRGDGSGSFSAPDGTTGYWGIDGFVRFEP